MRNNKSTPIIIIGVAIFIIGGAALFLLLRNNNSNSGKSNNAARTVITTTTTEPGSVALNVTTATTLAPIVIPPGDDAVSVQLDYFAGAGGFARAGSQVDIYAVINKDCATPGRPAAVKLIFSNVKVLEVLSSPVGQTGSSSSFLLALTPQQAEKLIFNQKFNSLYFTLTSGGAGATTTGVTCTNQV